MYLYILAWKLSRFKHLPVFTQLQKMFSWMIVNPNRTLPSIWKFMFIAYGQGHNLAWKWCCLYVVPCKVFGYAHVLVFLIVIPICAMLLLNDYVGLWTQTLPGVLNFNLWHDLLSIFFSLLIFLNNIPIYELYHYRYYS